MRGREELVSRCIDRKKRKLGVLSPGAYDELVQAVKEDPVPFIETPEEEAFCILVETLDAYHERLAAAEYTNEEDFQRERDLRIQTLLQGCEEALGYDERCQDALLLRVLAQNPPSAAGVKELMSLVKKNKTFVWENIWDRPQLRIRAALSRMLLDTGRYRQSLRYAKWALDQEASDPLGARKTALIALARLEDVAGFEKLVREEPPESPWVLLCRSLLSFKLGQEAGATAALQQFVFRREGGACALLHPGFVEVYLPDRPQVEPFSFEESLQVIREAETALEDCPDFIDWCASFDWLNKASDDFADEHGFEWE